MTRAHLPPLQFSSATGDTCNRPKLETEPSSRAHGHEKNAAGCTSPRTPSRISTLRNISSRSPADREQRATSLRELVFGETASPPWKKVPGGFHRRSRRFPEREG